MKFLAFLVLSLIVCSCAVQVKSIYDPNVDFVKYKTFCWLQGCEFTYTGPSYLKDSVIREQIKKTIIEVLESKGLKQNDAESDLLVDFHITMEHETILVSHVEFQDDYFTLFTDEEVERREVLKGTLIIDLVDRAKSTVVWRSAAVRYMDINPELTGKNIHNGISRALKDYPPSDN